MVCSYHKYKAGMVSCGISSQWGCKQNVNDEYQGKLDNFFRVIGTVI